MFVLTDVFHSVRHTVNTDYPERNGDVFIIDVPRMDGVDPDKKYCGYAIFFRMDPRWARDYKEIDWYSCKVYAPNKLLVKMPAWPYALFSNEDRKILQTYLRNKEPLLESLDNKRKGFATEQGQPKKDRMFKFILLDFGSEVKLSSKVVYSNAGEEEQCEWEFYPIPHLKNKSVSNIQCQQCSSYPNQGEENWAAFTVARVDKEPILVGELPVATTNESMAAKLLQGRGGYL